MNEETRGSVVNGIAFTNLNSSEKKNLLAGSRKKSKSDLNEKTYNIVIRSEVKK